MIQHLSIPILILAVCLATTVRADDVTTLLAAQALINQNNQNANNSGSASNHQQDPQTPSAPAAPTPDPDKGVIDAANGLLDSLGTLTTVREGSNAAVLGLLGPPSDSNRDNSSGSGGVSSDGSSQVVGQGYLAAIAKENGKISLDSARDAAAADEYIKKIVDAGNTEIEGEMKMASTIGSTVLQQQGDAAAQRDASPSGTVGSRISALGGLGTKSGSPRRGGGFGYVLQSRPPQPPTDRLSAGGLRSY